MTQVHDSQLSGGLSAVICLFICFNTVPLLCFLTAKNKHEQCVLNYNFAVLIFIFCFSSLCHTVPRGATSPRPSWLTSDWRTEQTSGLCRREDSPVWGGLGGRTRKEDCEGGVGGRAGREDMSVCERLWRCDQLCHYLAVPHPSALGELPGFLKDRGGEENPGWLTSR